MGGNCTTCIRSSPTTDTPSTGIATTIDDVSIDLLQNIFSRLPASSFASAACVSRSWNRVCERIFCRPKLSCACSFNRSLHDAVEEVVNKVLSEPIRPQFAIAYVGNFKLHEAHQLIIAKLGSKFPIITKWSAGVIGRDAISDEFQEWDDSHDPKSRAIMLVVGSLPGIKVETITPQIGDPLALDVDHVMVDKFVTDIWEFSTSVSGCKSPAAILIFGRYSMEDMLAIVDKMDYALSPETPIVGETDYSCFLHSNGSSRNITTFEKNARVVALVFVADRNKPPGIGEIKFHAILSSGLLPVSRAYKATSVKAHNGLSTILSARIEGSHENLDGDTIIDQAYEGLGGQPAFYPLYIGVTKRRKCPTGQENVGGMTSLAFHPTSVFLDAGYHTSWDYQESLIVDGIGIKRGDTFCFYRLDSRAALSSVTNVSNHLRSFKQESATAGDKCEVFGGLIFNCSDRDKTLFGQPNFFCSPFLDNFPGVTLGGIVCRLRLWRGDLTSYVKDSQEQKSWRYCLHEQSVCYLIISYTA